MTAFQIRGRLRFIMKAMYTMYTQIRLEVVEPGDYDMIEFVKDEH